MGIPLLRFRAYGVVKMRATYTLVPGLYWGPSSLKLLKLDPRQKFMGSHPVAISLVALRTRSCVVHGPCEGPQATDCLLPSGLPSHTDQDLDWTFGAIYAVFVPTLLVDFLT